MVSPSEALASEAPLRESFGPFVLVRKIAVGGSAEVFLAQPKRGSLPAPTLVIKRLRDRDAGDRGYVCLAREAELHNFVQHDNVVRVFGAGMVDDVPYIAMEYVPGVDLHRLLNRARSEQRAIPVDVAVYIARKIAFALNEVHNAVDSGGAPMRLVHGDVTPSNIYLSTDGAIKLGDFGIARTLNELTPDPDAPPPSERASVPGKFGYLAPEQLNGESHDHRADLFALAILLGELASGGPVFEGHGKLALLLSIRDANITPLRTARKKFPPGLMAVLERALQKDPADRYQTALELAEALAEFQPDDAVEARRQLGELVTWAGDTRAYAAHLETNVSNAMRRRITPASGTRRIGEEIHPGEPSAVRRRDSLLYEGLRLSKLVELIATGSLSPDDEVSFMGQPFARLSEIAELEPHLIPTTGATTGRMYEPGTPDYVVSLAHVSPLEVFARMRREKETGALFASRVDSTGRTQRRDVYLQDGRLLHVEASSTADLLGQYLVRKQLLTQEQLEEALAARSRYGGRLGDTLIGLDMVDAMDVYRAIRNQGRDRVAGLCGWTEGDVQFYRGGSPGPIHFPLDLDITVAMMAGLLTASGGKPELPPNSRLLEPGPLAPAPGDHAAIGTSPTSLQLVPALARVRVTTEVAIREITSYIPERNARITGEQEATAALLTAAALQWISFRA